MKYVATIEDKELIVEVIDDRHIRVGDRLLEVDFESVSGQPVFSLIVDGKSFEAFVYPGDDDNWQVLLKGRQLSVKVEDEREKRLRVAGGSAVAEGAEYHMRAPMPGLVVSVNVEEGQEVSKGQVLVVLESMKMQNELKAARGGTVSRIRVKPGETVEQKQTLLTVQ
jgi:biotin carboxyl carrier protein